MNYFNEIVVKAFKDLGIYKELTGSYKSIDSILMQEDVDSMSHRDPKIINIIARPTESEEIFGAVQEGSWTTERTNFPSVFDFSECGGKADAYPFMKGINRQSIYLQTWAHCSRYEVAISGSTERDWFNDKKCNAIRQLKKSINLINLFGVEGMQLYGALNDPNLLSPLQASPKVDKNGEFVGNSWDSINDPLQIYNDILRSFERLVKQTDGNVERESPMTLIIPTDKQVCLIYGNSSNIFLETLIKDNFPNMKIKTLAELSSRFSGGRVPVSIMMLFVDEIDGHPVVSTAFTEKLQFHGVEKYSDYQRQKMSCGTWGTIWFYPMACVQMIGI